MGKGIIMLSVYLRLRAEPHEILRMMFIVKFQYFYDNFVRLEVVIKNAPVLKCFNRCNKSFSQPKCFVTRHPKGSNPALFVDQVLGSFRHSNSHFHICNSLSYSAYRQLRTE